MDERNVVGLIQAVFVIPALYYFVTRLWYPARYWKEPVSKRETKLEQGLQYAGYFWLWIGFGILGFYVVGGIFSWMPDSWGGVDEDGNWESTRDVLQRGIGFFGGLAVMYRLSEMGEVFVKQKVQERFTMKIIEALSAPRMPNDSVTDLRNRHRSAAKAALDEPRQWHEEDAERKYRERLLNWLN